ncbi:hypothetical protein [Sinomicrobium weinanense]|uniref:Uncharacterized protein n=1 Tax=Sinomicrobium weinanense TaxID=2842200 RepID=A0A926JPT9_9FLAO|nr:hypothetical protein [Sinomicrobium weinanense]MBC9795072.1 hypothetical protein [Sinomicrobium weinanense]MBU3123799.1 hypothetical protein [Sinomicrobium weinanense]
MKTIRPLLVILSFYISHSCASQQTMPERDKELAAMYDHFQANRDKDARVRDSVLARFKAELKKTLKKENSKAYPFKALSGKVKIAASRNGKLRIFSWQPYPDGCYHIYHAIYQYDNNGRMETGELASIPGNDHTADLSYTGISEITDNNFLLLGYGTRCGGEDFYTLRNLIFNDGNAKDCRECFAGKDALVFIKPRAVRSVPGYDPETQTISYPEYGKNEETGFYAPTGKTITLQYDKNTSAFIAKDN